MNWNVRYAKENCSCHTGLSCSAQTHLKQKSTLFLSYVAKKDHQLVKSTLAAKKSLIGFLEKTNELEC